MLELKHYMYALFSDDILYLTELFREGETGGI